MKVALLTPTFYGFSGIDRVVEQQAKELVEAGDEVTIFAFKSDHEPSHGNLELLYSPCSIALERLYRLLFPLDLVTTFKLVKRLKSYDTVISHHYPMNWPALLAKRFWGSRYVYYNHGIAPPELFTRPAEKAYMYLFHRLTNLTIQGADHIVSVSEYLRSEMQRQLGLDGEVRYNRIDMARLALPRSIENASLREAVQGEGIIFSIGRVVPYKGLHLLLEAFRLAHQQQPGIKLLVAGDLSRFPGYHSELTEGLNSAVKFLGYISDEELAFCYAHCDVYATASLWEGFDLPVVEAQAFSKPVVAFDVGPHREVVKDGETGILVQPRDVQGFARAVLDTMEQKDTMGRRAKECAQKFVPSSGEV